MPQAKPQQGLRAEVRLWGLSLYQYVFGRTLPPNSGRRHVCVIRCVEGTDEDDDVCIVGVPHWGGVDVLR